MATVLCLLDVYLVFTAAQWLYYVSYWINQKHFCQLRCECLIEFFSIMHKKKTRFIRFVTHQRSKNYRYANRYEIVTYVSRNLWSRAVMTNESIEDVWRSFTLLQITTDEDSHRHNLNLNLWITPYLRNGEMLVTHLTRNLSHTKATFILHSWSWHLS